MFKTEKMFRLFLVALGIFLENACYGIWNTYKWGVKETEIARKCTHHTQCQLVQLVVGKEFCGLNFNELRSNSQSIEYGWKSNGCGLFTVWIEFYTINKILVRTRLKLLLYYFNWNFVCNGQVEWAWALHYTHIAHSSGIGWL